MKSQSVNPQGAAATVTGSFAAGQEPTLADVVATLRSHKATIDRWLDQKSLTFTQISGEVVSRRTVLRIHLLLLSLIALVLCLNDAPWHSIASAITASWLTWRLKQTPKAERDNSHD